MEVREGGLSVAQYTYDARNRRITKTVDTLTVGYVYDNSQVIEEYEDNTLARSFVYGPVIDDPLLLETGGERYYYLKDRRHSVTALTDAAGAVVERYEYSAFGLMSVYDSEGLGVSGSALGNPYGYTGRRWDAESGLWHYRNRAYSPTLGRFMQRDPAGYVDGMNLYAYVGNNPVNRTDPFGLTWRAGNTNKIGQVPGYPETGKDSWRATNDDIFIQATENYNNMHKLAPGDQGYWTPERLKAQAMIESGGNKQAFLTDPLQVNKSADWDEAKSRIVNLQRGQDMTPSTSAAASLEWSRYKGYIHDNKGNEVQYRGDYEALRRYNGNTDTNYSYHPGVEHRDWYAEKILTLEKTMLTKEE